MSDYPISFHYCSVAVMYDLEYYVYHLQPYGIIHGLQNLNKPRDKPVEKKRAIEDQSDTAKDQSGAAHDQSGSAQDQSGVAEDQSGVAQDQSGAAHDQSDAAHDQNGAAQDTNKKGETVLNSKLLKTLDNQWAKHAEKLKEKANEQDNIVQ